MQEYKEFENTFIVFLSIVCLQFSHSVYQSQLHGLQWIIAIFPNNMFRHSVAHVRWMKKHCTAADVAECVHCKTPPAHYAHTFHFSSFYLTNDNFSLSPGAHSKLLHLAKRMHSNTIWMILFGAFESWKWVYLTTNKGTRKRSRLYIWFRNKLVIIFISNKSLTKMAQRIACLQNDNFVMNSLVLEAHMA